MKKLFLLLVMITFLVITSNAQRDVHTYDRIYVDMDGPKYQSFRVEVSEKFITIKTNGEFSEYKLTLNKKWENGGSYEGLFLDGSGYTIKYWWYPPDENSLENYFKLRHGWVEIYTKNGNLKTKYDLFMTR